MLYYPPWASSRYLYRLLGLLGLYTNIIQRKDTSMILKKFVLGLLGLLKGY